jgi:MFS transporter, NNP family, nitrate/nitrite transporter
VPRSTHGGRTATPETSAPPGHPGTMLALATVGFLVNFWAWALISPLGVAYRDLLGLTAFEQALLVAVPVVVGSVGRIPVGALTDRLGARVMFPAVSFLTILPVLFVGLFGDSYPPLLLGGFFLGIGGTAFAVGVPLVNAWYPPARRGLALGVFGMGMGRCLRVHHRAARQPLRPPVPVPAGRGGARGVRDGRGAAAPRRRHPARLD